MPIYEFDLSDGTTVTVESETEPTDEQVLGALQTQEVPVEEPRFTQNLGQVLSAPQPELPPQTIPYSGIPESMGPMVDWERFQAGPTFAEERTTGIPSAAGLTPEVVPSGRAVSEVMQGIPATSLPFEPLRGVLASEIPATLTSSVAKTGIGLAEYLSSPQGVTEFVASMTPAKLLVLGKWAVDMAKGAGQEAGALSTLLGKPNKTRDDWQAISDHSINTAVMVFGAGATARGVARPVTRALTPAKVKAAQELSRLLETTEPMGTVQPRQPIRQLGIPQAALTAEPFLQPGIPAKVPAAKPANALADALRKFEDTGEIETVRDLVDEVDAMIGEGTAPESLQTAVKAFRDAVHEDFEMAGRSDLDAAENAFLQAVRAKAGKTKAEPEAPPAAPTAAKVDVSSITKAKTEDEMLKATGELMRTAKTAEEIDQVQEASKAWTAPPAEPPGAPKPDLISKLESLKFPETGEGNLYSLPHPDAIKAIGVSTWNSAVEIAIASVKAGKAFAKAIDDAIAYLRKNVRGLDEAQARANLEYVAREETRPAAAPTPERAKTPAAAIEFPEATRSVVDPITGEPAKVITETAARSMESKVKLSSQVDVDKLKAQLELFDKEIGDALESGGQFLPKEMRPEVAKGAPAERKTVTNKEINQYFVNKLSSIRKQMKATRLKILREADIDSQVYYDSLQKQFEKAFQQIQELRRASHESLYFWNKIRAEYQEIARAAGRMPEIKRQMPIINQILKDVREKSFQQAGRHFADFLRLNLFTPGSWTLDFTTNFVAAANRLPIWAIMDTGSFIAGTPSARLLTATRALANNMKNWNPFGKRFRLPDQIETELGTTMAGEFGGSPRQVMIDFKEYLPNHPKLAEKLNYLDLLIAGQVRMKRAVDSFFGRFGATAELYNRAYTEGRLRGLKGDELKQFSEDFVQNPPETAIASAVKTGKEIKFNRDLSNVEERFASSLGMKLFVEAFPRWTFQFMRWGGEMIGVDPKFFKDFVTGKATAEQTVTYLTKAATGWGGIYAFNQLFYDNIDEQTMEYVKENGDRVRLAGRTPAPELFFICALLRGDTQTAKLALPYLSLPLAKLVGGEPGGLLSSMIDTFRESLRGRYTAEQTARELNNLVNNAIPGKSMLGLIRSFYDPTIREGIGAPIPGVASLLPQPVDPTTGEPRAPKQRIPGIPIDIPTVGGTPFPGATRVLNDIETALLNHRLGLRRPRRTSIIELPAEDVPKEVRREYEVAVANYVKEFVGGVITDPEFKAMEYEDRRNLLQKMMEAARLNAKYDLADKYGTSAEPTLSTPLLLRRVPERMRTPAAPAP